MKTHPPTPAVRESFGQAQQQAAAMVAGPPTPWNKARNAQHRSPLWIGVAAMAVAAGGVAGWLGVDWLNRPARVGSAATPTSPGAVDRAIAPALPASVTTAAVAPVIVAPPSLTVTRHSGLIRIASSNASLADAVRELALATHTNVKGAEALAAVANPITLNWQGSDTPAAWDALLGRFASTAISCGGASCELWIVSVNASRAAGGAASGPAPAPAVAAPAQPQGGEENSETN